MLTHQERDEPTKLHAKDYLTSEALLLDDLMQMQKADSFVALGFRNLFVYCVDALHLSEAQACYYQKVARKSVEVPQLRSFNRN